MQPEVVGAHQLIETAWQLCSRNDDETQNSEKCNCADDACQS